MAFVDSQPLHWFVGIVLAGFFLVAPFYQGLFFAPEQLWAILFLGTLYLVFTASRAKRRNPVGSLFDLAVFLLPVAYLLSVFVAIDPRSAIQSTLVRVGFVIVFLLGRELVNIKNLRILMATAVALSAAWIGLFGFLVKGKLFQFTGDYVGNRLNSTFQYPNATAAYLLMGLMVSLGLWLHTTGKWRYAYLGLSSLFFVPIVFTYSRGVWLGTPVTLILFVLLLPKGSRLRGVLAEVGVLLAAIPGILLMHAGLPTDNLSLLVAGFFTPVPVLLFLDGVFGLFNRLSAKAKWISLGVVLFVGLGTLFGFLVKKAASPFLLTPQKVVEVPMPYQQGSNQVTVRAQGTGAGHITIRWYDSHGVATVLKRVPLTPTAKTSFKVPHLAAQATVAVHVTKGSMTLQSIVDNGHAVSLLLPKVLPQSIYHRLISINGSQLSVWERFAFWGTALSMWSTRPFLGFGGGGWRAYYQHYESFAFISGQVHSAYLQTFVDTGLVGGVIYLGIWVLFVRSIMRARKKTSLPILLAGLATAALALGGHSAMDFDMSLSIIAFAAFFLMGMVHGLERADESLPERNWQSYFPAVFTTIGAVLSGSLLLGYYNGQTGAGLMNQHHLNQAKPYYLAAMAHDPWTASFHIDYGNILLALSHNQGTLVSQGLGQISQGVALASTNPVYHLVYANALMQHGQLAAAQSQYQAAIQDEPLQITAYAALAQTDAIDGLNLILQHHLKQGRLQIEHVLQVAKEVVDRRQKEPNGLPANLYIVPPTARMAMAVGQAEAILTTHKTTLQKALGNLLVASRDAHIALTSNFWLAYVEKRLGNAKAEQQFLSVVLKSDKTAASQLSSLATELKAVRA